MLLRVLQLFYFGKIVVASKDAPNNRELYVFWIMDFFSEVEWALALYSAERVLGSFFSSLFGTCSKKSVKKCDWYRGLELQCKVSQSGRRSNFGSFTFTQHFVASFTNPDGHLLLPWVLSRFLGKSLGWSGKRETWLILPVVICLSQRLSHACLSISLYTTKLRKAH